MSFSLYSYCERRFASVGLGLHRVPTVSYGLVIFTLNISMNDHKKNESKLCKVYYIKKLSDILYN